MSRERELLKKAIKIIETLGPNEEAYEFINEILLLGPEQENNIDYFVKEIHKKCFHQALDTAPVVSVRDALSIFRKFLKSKRTPVVKPKFDQEEFDEMVRKGTEAWSGVDVNKFFDELNELDKAVKQSENLGKMYDEL